MDAYDNIINLLNKNKIKYNLITHQNIYTSKDAEQLNIFDLKKCCKTLAFQHHDQFLFIVLLAEYKVDYSKLCKQLNIKRSHLKKLPSETLVNELGFELGGIAPFSFNTKVTIIIDEAIKSEKQLFCGSGKNNITIEIAAKDLISLQRNKVFSFAKK